MSPWVALHNVQALLHIAKEVEFHADVAIHAANRVISSSEWSVDWGSLYALGTHAGCAGAFLETSPSRGKTLTSAFPGRAEALSALTAIDEDLTGIKQIRDAMIHADERLEAEWLRLEGLGESRERIQMRAVGPLPADGRALINWDPASRQLSARAAAGKAITLAVEYNSVDVVELRDRLRNVEFGASRLADYIRTMSEGTPGVRSLPPRATKTVSTDPR